MTNERAIELLNRISDSQFDGEYGDERREALEMAVRALEQNLVKESDGLVNDLVKDCISRQQAIDALDKHIDTFDAIDTNYLCGLRTAMSILKEMPSAQPETHDKRTETHECDLINRQQAIDAVRNAKFYFRIKAETYLRDAGDAVNEIVCQVSETYVKALLDVPPAERPQFWIDSEGKLSALPSAQPNVHDPEKDADCISRQQAIEALNNILAEYVPYLHGYTEGIPLECAVAIQTLPHIHEAKTCTGCHFEKHGSRACDHCSRMYMDRYEVRNDG